MTKPSKSKSNPSKKSTPAKKPPRKSPTKPEPKRSGPAKAASRRQDDPVVRAAEEWAREVSLADVRRLAEAPRGSWLSARLPFAARDLPPSHGLYRVIFGPESDLHDADEVRSYWHAVLGDDAELLDDPADARRFVDRVREVYAERVAEARWGR